MVKPKRKVITSSSLRRMFLFTPPRYSAQAQIVLNDDVGRTFNHSFISRGPSLYNENTVLHFIATKRLKHVPA